MAEMSLKRHCGHVLVFFLKKKDLHQYHFRREQTQQNFRQSVHKINKSGTTKKTHLPVKVLTHSNSWKSHNLMDMSAEHDA